jgi:putative transposase
MPFFFPTCIQSGVRVGQVPRGLEGSRVDGRCRRESEISLPAAYRGLPELDYPFHANAVTVTASGRICFNHQKVNFSTVVAGQAVAISKVDDHLWVPSFMHYDLGYIELEAENFAAPRHPFGPRLLPVSPV